MEFILRNEELSMTNLMNKKSFVKVSNFDKAYELKKLRILVSQNLSILD